MSLISYGDIARGETKKNYFSYLLVVIFLLRIIVYLSPIHTKKKKKYY